MRHRPGLLFAVLSTLTTCLAVDSHADGMNLTWGDGCWADNPQTVQTFACGSNTGSFSMTASFSLTADFPGFSDMDVYLDLQSDAPNLPDWWQMCFAGGCRTGSINAAADFNAAPGGCTYAWPGSTPRASFVWRTFQWCDGNLVFSSPSRAQLFASFFNSTAANLHHGTEYYAFRVTIDTQKTAGSGVCGGCATPATIVLNTIHLFGSIQQNLTTPLANTCLRWQAAGTTPCSATPVRNMTWGAIKSFYR
ncbi:MAG TPA: hypothetical protein VMJ70_04435 [Candidatus Sulfotelmatobacter sp.]|nr:hypothetical protein [Candidatus Sulfotelmatobacter sp.]